MKIQLRRSGGFGGLPARQVSLDLSTLPEGERRPLEALVKATGFFSLAAESASGRPDCFQYEFEIEPDAGAPHRVHTDDGAMPEALKPLLARLKPLLTAAGGR